MAGPGNYILFSEDHGEFALDCLTGSIHGRCEGNAVEFTWEGNDEMEATDGHGWAELQDDARHLACGAFDLGGAGRAFHARHPIAYLRVQSCRAHPVILTRHVPELWTKNDKAAISGGFIGICPFFRGSKGSRREPGPC